MILADLKNYIEQHKRVHLTDISTHFDTDSGAIRGMLQKWIIKGRVRKVAVTPSCGTGCCKCDPDQFELYEWVEL